jgi:hypothetical protein
MSSPEEPEIVTANSGISALLTISKKVIRIRGKNNTKEERYREALSVHLKKEKKKHHFSKNEK